MRFLERQRELQVGSYGEDPAELEDGELAHFIFWNVVALDHELHEALDEVTGWKPWSSKSTVIENRESYVKELVDAYHFLGNLLLVAGVTDDELDQKYNDKAAINERRQTEGYSR